MESDKPTKPRIIDIALLAGVGTATVDRVLNGRAGVKAKTVAKVMEAARFLEQSGGRPAVTAPLAADMNLRIFLGGNPGFANEILARHLRDAAHKAGVAARLEFVRRTDCAALADRLRDCLSEGVSGVIVQPVEHPLIRDAIAELQAGGIHVTTVLSFLPNLDGLDYVGLDNRAAGRLAGQITGLLCNKIGNLAVFHSDAIYRSHEEREAGLRSILREDFPQMQITETISTDDDPNICYRRAAEILARNTDITALINLAAGNRGIERALQDSGRASDIVFVSFNLTPLSRKALIEGRMQAVIHQDMRTIAQAAINAQIARHQGAAPRSVILPAQLVLRENTPPNDQPQD